MHPRIAFLLVLLAADATLYAAQKMVDPSAGALNRAAPQKNNSEIDYQLRTLLARARVEGKERVVTLVLARRAGPEGTRSATRAIRAKSGLVQVEFEEIGYLRALVPEDQVQMLERDPAIEV